MTKQHIYILISLLFITCNSDLSSNKKQIDYFDLNIAEIPKEDDWRILINNDFGVDFSILNLIYKEKDTIKVYVGDSPNFPRLIEKRVLNPKLYELYKNSEYDMSNFIKGDSLKNLDKNRFYKYDIIFKKVQSGINLRIFKPRDNNYGHINIFIDSIGGTDKKIHIYSEPISPHVQESTITLLQGIRSKLR
jgi:hypothetical protein